MTTLARLTNEEKARRFDANPLSNLPPMLDPNFRWITMDCQVLTTREMKTPHLFNSLKMIWNNTVPEEYRVGNFKEYRGVVKWPRSVRKHAITCLYHELIHRPDITSGMVSTLKQMADYMQHLPKRLTNAS